MRLLIAGCLAAALCAAPGVAAAQSVPGGVAAAPSPGVSFAQGASVRRARPPAAKTKKSLRVFGLYESESLAATKSFTAILGRSKLGLAGGGADFSFWKGLFLRATFSGGSASGSRVFVTSSQQVIPLGIPVKEELGATEIGLGWRVRPLDRRGRLVPYAGLVGLWRHYKETSQFADPGEDTDLTFTGQSLFGGAEIRIKFISVGVEGLLRRLPDALDGNGVSQAFNEKDLGGGVIRVVFGVRF